MKVIKIGGGCLDGREVVSSITDLMLERGKGNIFVLSALSGVTDILIDGIDQALVSEEKIRETMNRLKEIHIGLGCYLIPHETELNPVIKELEILFLRVERYYYGVSFTREATPRMKDIIVSFGEMLSVTLISGVIRSRGGNASFIMPREAGIVTDGKFADATADLRATFENFKTSVLPLIVQDRILLIPGFFGLSPEGEVTTFGRGGSDYSAAVVASASGADILEIWKDTQGFMSADPHVVTDARLIPELSYEEAAELAYSGASILHPRTVEPVRKTNIKIAIRNRLNPELPGSIIRASSVEAETIIKSVSHTRDIAVLKVYASGVGARQGILAGIAGTLSDKGINIKSVVTSQTCISLLLARRDIEKSHAVLRNITPRPYRESEQIIDTALISIVGDGLHRHRGIAARCFTAVAEAGVNIEMISFGPSRCALYFLVHENDLEKTLKALHSFFF